MSATLSLIGWTPSIGRSILELFGLSFSNTTSCWPSKFKRPSFESLVRTQIRITLIKHFAVQHQTRLAISSTHCVGYFFNYAPNKHLVRTSVTSLRLPENQFFVTKSNRACQMNSNRLRVRFACAAHFTFDLWLELRTMLSFTHAGRFIHRLMTWTLEPLPANESSKRCSPFNAPFQRSVANRQLIAFANFIVLVPLFRASFVSQNPPSGRAGGSLFLPSGHINLR